MTIRIDQDEICEIIRDVSARLIKPRFNNLQQEHIRSKSHANDLVTDADEETEAEMCQILPKKYPGIVVIGEEGVSKGIVTTDVLKDFTKAVFVIDPVDGTSNFVHGKDEWAFMMALVENGETTHGWIYDVLQDRFMIAEKGAGTTLSGNRVRVAPLKSMDQATGFWRKAYFPKDSRPYFSHLAEEEKNLKKVFSLGCSAHEYLRISSGHADFGINGMMRPWDHLAGALMVQEAGGIVTKWDGSPYTPQDETGGMIVASNLLLHEYLNQRIVQPGLNKWKAAAKP